MRANPIKMLGRLKLKTAAFTIAQVLHDTKRDAFGDAVYFRLMPKEEISVPTAFGTADIMIAALADTEYEFEPLSHKGLKAQQNDTPGATPIAVKNHSDLAKIGNDILQKLENPQDLVYELFPKSIKDMDEAEMMLAIDKMHIAYNQLRTYALQRGITLRQQANKHAKEADDTATDEAYQRSPSRQKQLKDKVKKTGDPKLRKLLSMFMDLDLHKDPANAGYQNWDANKLKTALLKGSM